MKLAQTVAIAGILLSWICAEPLAAAPLAPTSVSGLVGWWDAQKIAGPLGQNVTSWADQTDLTNNTIANPLLHVTGDLGGVGGTQTSVAPTLQSVAWNGGAYQSVRFAANNAGDYDLLRANNLVANGDTNRTVMVVYQGGADNDQSRIVGFGSLSADVPVARTNWALTTDANGSSRFDGAFIAGYDPGLNRTDVVVRTATMNSFTNFNEYGKVLNTSFTDSQILSGGIPNNSLGSVVGNFHVGDIAPLQVGGGSANAQVDVLEILVYDAALTAAQRQGVQLYLVDKYIPKVLETNFDGSSVSGATLSGSTFNTAPGVGNISNFTGDHNFRQNGTRGAGNLSLDVNFSNDPTTGFEFSFDLDPLYVGTLSGMSLDLAKTNGQGEFNLNPATQGWIFTASIFENGATLLGEVMTTYEITGQEADFTRVFFPDFASPIKLIGGNSYTVDFSIIQSQFTGGHFFSASNLQLFGHTELVPEPASLVQLLLLTTLAGAVAARRRAKRWIAAGKSIAA